MRCLVLAKRFDEVIFATKDLKGNINYKIPYKKIIIKDDKEIFELVKELDIDMVVIDSYNISYEFEKELHKFTKVMVIDDMYKKHFCDILLNHNISANKKRYKKLVPNFCKIQCGEKYTLLRDEFYKSYKFHNKKFTIFIGMGGVDTENLTLKILKLLHKFINIEVNIVTTKSNPNVKKLQQYTKNKPWIKLFIDSKEVAYLMKKSDLGIVTASGFSNEYYFLKKPFIAIKVVNNQINMYNFLKKKGYFVLDGFDKYKLLQYLKKVIV